MVPTNHPRLGAAPLRPHDRGPRGGRARVGGGAGAEVAGGRREAPSQAEEGGSSTVVADRILTASITEKHRRVASKKKDEVVMYAAMELMAFAWSSLAADACGIEQKSTQIYSIRFDC